MFKAEYFEEKEKDKFQRIVYVNYKLKKIVYLLDAMNFRYDKGFANPIICKTIQKIIASICFLSFLLECELGWDPTVAIKETSLKLKSKLGLFMFY